MNRKMFFWFVLLVSVCIFEGYAQADGSGSDSAGKVVWFDGAGAYQYCDPLPYLNDVLAGTRKDEEVKALLLEVCKDSAKILPEHLEKIADAANPLTHTFALFLPGSKTLEKQRKTIQDHFNASAPGATLMIKSFSFQVQGDISLITSAADANVLIALPADPSVLAVASNQVSDSVQILEVELKKGAKNPDWTRFAKTTAVGPGGMSTLVNLSPGPWVVYLNQHNLITQCYRIIIKPDMPNELIADKTCCPPRVEPKIKDSDAKKES